MKTSDQTDLYRYYDESGHLLYIGISGDFLTRTNQHRRNSFWYKYAKTITIQKFCNRTLAIRAEREAIKREKPEFNIEHNERINLMSRKKTSERLEKNFMVEAPEPNIPSKNCKKGNYNGRMPESADEFNAKIGMAKTETYI